MQADLVDYAATGTKVELVGTEKVEGRDTYKVKITLKSGQALHVWIDPETFLETKIEGQPNETDHPRKPTYVITVRWTGFKSR